MEITLAEVFAQSESGRQAEEIIRRCVHCGMCNAVCPTYRLTGNELDGPRGRIYLIKSIFEEGEANEIATQHLDRCLTCRACETACPSGVPYGELAEVARPHLRGRHPGRNMLRWLFISLAESPKWFVRLFKLGSAFRGLLPGRFRALLTPPRTYSAPKQESKPSRRRGLVIVLQGCVQRAATPQVNASLRALLETAGYEVMTLEEEACCGALALHLGEEERAKTVMQRGLRVLAPHLDRAVAIISSASGCGVTLKDYGRLLASDEAQRFSELVLDASEFLADPRHGIRFAPAHGFRKVAWHNPCTLQHGSGLGDQVEVMLSSAGYQLTRVADSNQCCGSAGSYSLFEPEMATALRSRKLECLQADAPEAIATANVGCQMFLGQASGVPVYHWLELVVHPTDTQLSVGRTTSAEPG